MLSFFWVKSKMFAPEMMVWWWKMDTYSKVTVKLKIFQCHHLIPCLDYLLCFIGGPKKCLTLPNNRQSNDCLLMQAPSDTNRVNITQLQAMSNTFLSCGLSLTHRHRVERAPPSVTVVETDSVCAQISHLPRDLRPWPGCDSTNRSDTTENCCYTTVFNKIKKEREKKKTGRGTGAKCERWSRGHWFLVTAGNWSRTCLQIFASGVRENKSFFIRKKGLYIMLCQVMLCVRGYFGKYSFAFLQKVE